MKSISIPATFLLVGFLALVSSVDAFQVETNRAVRYEVDLSDVGNRYVTVEMDVTPDGDETELMMAVWTPGSYLVREYARHIDSMTVTDGDGEPLDYFKTRKNRWIVNSKSAELVRVRYRIYCNEKSVRTNFVTGDYAVLNGAPTFITLPDRLEEKHIVKLDMPSSWKRSATSLTLSDEASHQYVAESFDELVDSPIVAGNLQVYPFDVGGVPHQLVNVGERGMWDGTKAAADLKKVVQAHHKIWRVVPYKKYLFLNVLCGGGGGLEHDNSTLVLSSRWTFRDENRYKSWLSLCSHEFFHTWNVRRLRPKPLMKYDYENEIYTDGLWIAEGITSYYQHLALVRAGLTSKNKFLSEINGDISTIQRAEGRKFQSLRDSSFDTWIKFYRPDENSRNTRVSYYSKGAVVAFLLDLKIRELTENKKSLDDVMRKMFRRFSKTGFTSKDFRSTASSIAGEDLSDWFRKAIDSTEELDYGSGLTYMGIKVPAAAIEKDAPDSEEGPDEEYNGPLSFGAIVSGTRISRTISGSQAQRLGLSRDDEILAVDGFRLDGSLSNRLRQYQLGDQVELLMSRDGVMFSESVTLEKTESESWSIRWLSEPNEAQKARIEQWLSFSKPKPKRKRKADADADAEKAEKADVGSTSQEKVDGKPKSKKSNKKKSKKKKRGSKGKKKKQEQTQDLGPLF